MKSSLHLSSDILKPQLGSSFTVLFSCISHYSLTLFSIWSIISHLLLCSDSDPVFMIYVISLNLVTLHLHYGQPGITVFANIAVPQPSIKSCLHLCIQHVWISTSILFINLSNLCLLDPLVNSHICHWLISDLQTWTHLVLDSMFTFLLALQTSDFNS